MIECRPIGICSWDFELRGEGHVATLGFGWPREQGWIRIGGKGYEIEKQGMLSGCWHLVHGGSVRSRAEKRSAFTRSFELGSESGKYVLEAASFATRGMTLQGRDADARIAPAHPFTRRAVIDGRLPDIELLSFAFWLTALTWRRAASNNAAAG